MKDTKASVHILPKGKTVKAYPGERLLDVLIRNGIFLRTDCGGEGRCHKCRVEKLEENSDPVSIDSCRHKVASDISIQIPASSMAASHIMTKAGLHFPPTFKDRRRSDRFRGKYGIAIDLGTTTIAMYLCDLQKGEVIASMAVKNVQALYGDDVMSRITAVVENTENLDRLHDLAVKSIDQRIRILLSSLEKELESPLKIVVVGNPTMIHIFTKTDPSSIGIAPYLPVFYNARRFLSDQLDFTFSGIPIQTLPNVSGFIGGDILAAAVAAEIKNQPDGTLLIDLGTNGELLLKTAEHLYATSCATGPAFEGATLSCGMQAMPGAINAVKINNDHKCSFSIIESPGHHDMKPTGICGTGILNAVAQLCQNGVIRPDGAFSNESDKFMLVPPDSGTGQLPIYISQKDIRSVQLGKSALMSGIEFLLDKAGLDQPEKIIVAGAMGAHVKKHDLIRLGMIPHIDTDEIEIAGNLAGSGAVMALCDEDYIDYATQLADRIEVIELAASIDFQDAFIKNLDFPEIENSL